MSLTYTRVPDGFDVWGKTLIQYRDITFDASYPASTGYVINAQDVGLKAILGATVVSGNQAAGAVVPAFDFGATAGNLKTSVALRLFLPTGGGSAPATLVAPVSGASSGVITNGAITAGANTVGGTATATPAAGATPVTSTGAQPAIPVNLSSVTVTSANPTQAASSFVPGTGLTGGIGLEVGNGTDVSSIIVRIRFEGR